MHMSKIQSFTHLSTLALRRRKAHLVRSFHLPPELLHASLVERFIQLGLPRRTAKTSPVRGIAGLAAWRVDW